MHKSIYSAIVIGVQNHNQMEFLRITMSSLVIGYDEDTGGGIGLSFHCSIGEASVGEFVHNSTSKEYL